MGQVTIKEKITINPKGIKIQTASRTLQVNFSRPAGVITQKPCNGTPLSNSLQIYNQGCGVYAISSIDNGSGSVSATVVSGVTHIYSGYNTVTEGTATVDVYLDGVLIKHAEHYGEPAAGCGYLSVTWDDGVSLQSRIDIGTVFSVIPHGSSNPLPLNMGSFLVCEATAWFPPTDPVTVTITQGSAYGSLHKSDGSSVGTSYTNVLGQLDLNFIADGVQPPSNGATVSIEASVQGTSDTVSFTVTRTVCNMGLPDCTYEPQFDIQKFETTEDRNPACGGANGGGAGYMRFLPDQFDPVSYSDIVTVCCDPTTGCQRAGVSLFRIAYVYGVCPSSLGGVNLYQNVSQITDKTLACNMIDVFTARRDECWQKAQDDLSGGAEIAVDIRNYAIYIEILEHERAHFPKAESYVEQAVRDANMEWMKECLTPQYADLLKSNPDELKLYQDKLQITIRAKYNDLLEKYRSADEQAALREQAIELQRLIIALSDVCNN